MIPEDGLTEGFEIILRNQWQRIHGVLFRLTGDSAEAEDLALEVFWRLYKRNNGSHDFNPERWIYRVAVNLGLNALRARRRRQRYEQEAGHLALETHQSEDPAVTVEQDQERQRAQVALGMIKPRSAQMLILRHSGMSYAEIAVAVGVSPASVGALLRRAEAEFEQAYFKAAG